MDIFKIASQLRLRFQTPKGELSTEQLWSLSLEELDSLAVSLETQHKESGKKSFIHKSTDKDRVAKLRFDVVLDILTTKVAQEEAASEALEIKAHNEKILGLIADKKDQQLANKSVAELTKQLRTAKAVTPFTE